MNIVSSSIPSHWFWLLWLSSALIGALVAWRARWSMLTDPRNLNIFLGATVAILALWLIKAGIKPGLNFHLLGATILTLMFRPMFALFGLGLVIAGITFWQGEYAAFAPNLLIMAVVPVAVSWAIYRLVDRHLPNHLFIYVFLNAFFGAAIAISAVGFASTGFAAFSGVYPMQYLLDEYLPYFLLMAWAEAFTTGMIVTLLVVYKPEWVATFDDKRYLEGK
ncbi:MAG: energy-coupling factor ABC transporter permease [Pseudomonadota bacterium]|nr:energy-coupling factor ABC transporter permease [Pseudomonadota bacterium]MDP1573174.1 energy-coupling factor ABC transporter permease [Pseudomonadota bacterium]MDP1904249.1 energy-coupling factor ABC transporter permease [Pseudomonadota bacterium]